MMSLSMGYSCSFNQQNNHGIKDEDDCVVPCSSSDDESSRSTIVSSDSDLFGQDEDGDEVDSNSSASSSPSGPLQDLSSLFQELPIKRGLSKHYNGKSQSFTSLANAISLEDLPKPENPFNKKLKGCKSYAGLLEMHSSSPPHRSASSSNFTSRKASSSRLVQNSSLSVRRNGIPPPHRSTSTSNFVGQNNTLFA